MKKFSNDLTYTEFYSRENDISHAPVEKELNFYECIKHGDCEAVKNCFTPLGGEGFGVLSEDSLQNLKYHLVITIAFITRFCVEGGMERETAYNLSDIYIRQADKAKNSDEINSLHWNAVMDYTDRMSRLPKEHVYSRPILKCFDYVYRHLNEKILLEDIAMELKLTPSYISRLFHQETGMTLNRYITKKRVETAGQMLLYSEYNAADIANFLSFSSHSRFIEVFKKETGYTPQKYRNKFKTGNKN
ncbi:MAG: helix-turn-helix transcriptional regulator [Ruminococcus sp.]